MIAEMRIGVHHIMESCPMPEVYDDTMLPKPNPQSTGDRRNRRITPSSSKMPVLDCHRTES